MTCCFLVSKHKTIWFRRIHVVIASLAALIAAANLADAASGRKEPQVTSIQTRAAGEPIMAIVSLRSQQITVDDTNGWILRAPVSSGQAGLERCP